MVILLLSSYFSALNSIFAFDILDVSFAMYSKVLLIFFVFLVSGGRLSTAPVWDVESWTELLDISLTITGKPIYFISNIYSYFYVLCLVFLK